LLYVFESCQHFHAVKPAANVQAKSVNQSRDVFDKEKKWVTKKNKKISDNAEIT